MTRKQPVWERTARDDAEIEAGAIRGALETLTRAMPASGRFDADAVTITAAVATATPVMRRDARGAYAEILDSQGFRLIGDDVILLDTHNQRSARATLGRAHNFRADGDAVLADLRFSLADDVAPIRQRVADGTLNSFSVGYAVQPRHWEDATGPQGRTRTARVWTITEVSLVGVPADPNSKRRSTMDDENDVIDPPKAEPTEAENRAAIRQIARAANQSAEWADEQIDSGTTIVEVRAAAFEAMQTRGRNTTRIRVVNPGPSPADHRRAREDALFVRVAGGTPSDAARPFVSDSLRDHARASLEAGGVSTRGMDPDQLFRAAMHTTSDFPALLQGVGNRTLMPAYQAAQSPLKALARQTTMVDFRTGSRLKLSDIGQLQKVSESGEIKSTTRGEASESYALDTFATIFALSRKALINDDLGAFRDWGSTGGRMAAETEANLLLTLLRQSSGAGPIMNEDNKRLFHADHGNLAGTGTVLDETNLSAARLAMRSMKSLDGKTPINAVPKTLLVGPQLETSAEKLLAAIYAATVAEANPFTGKLTLAVEPRILDKSWYVFADPAAVPVLEYAYLSSAPGPQLASREGFDVLGMEFRVMLDFGAGPVDWRGVYRNPGVA